jgi:hypothetical protein
MRLEKDWAVILPDLQRRYLIADIVRKQLDPLPRQFPFRTIRVHRPLYAEHLVKGASPSPEAIPLLRFLIVSGVINGGQLIRQDFELQDGRVNAKDLFRSYIHVVRTIDARREKRYSELGELVLHVSHGELCPTDRKRE